MIAFSMVTYAFIFLTSIAFLSASGIFLPSHLLHNFQRSVESSLLNVHSTAQTGDENLHIIRAYPTRRESDRRTADLHQYRSLES